MNSACRSCFWAEVGFLRTLSVLSISASDLTAFILIDIIEFDLLIDCINQRLHSVLK